MTNESTGEIKMQKHRTLAVITARGGSKGIPLKNIKPLNGIPLINYTITAALKSSCIDDIIVSTDHQGIADVSREAGALVPFMRPEELATDHAKSIDVVIHAVEEYENKYECCVDHVILLQPTSPLRTATDIDSAWEIYRKKNADSLQSVVEAADHPYYLRKVVEDRIYKFSDDKYGDNLRRQDLDRVYRVNGAIYIARRDLVLNQKTLTGEFNTAYIMSKDSSIDIDDILDFQFAEFIISAQNCIE